MNTETLQKLLDDGLAVMSPNDPARDRLTARLSVITDFAGPIIGLFFYDYRDTPNRDCHGCGKTADEALADFKANYKAPLTKADRIAALRAQLAELEGVVS